MASRRISLFYEERLAPAGLRVMQYSILSIIGRAQGASISEIAEALVLDRTATGKNLKPLERDGLIVLATSKADARSRVVRLTAAGRATLAVAEPLWRKAQREFEAAIGPTETLALKALLHDAITLE